VIDDAPMPALPRGRHSLTREQVATLQRRRIFLAMAALMAEKGYAATSIAQVLRRARVSRETFYEQFSSKEDCFMSALEEAVHVIFATTLETTAAPAPDPWERLTRALRSYLDALAEHPQYARMFLIEIYAAGPEALRRRAALQRRYADVIAATIGRDDEADHRAIEAFVVATSGMVTTRLAENDLDGVRALHGTLLDIAGRLLGRGIGVQQRS
jgi:AcrR family transcriptional regulator